MADNDITIGIGLDLSKASKNLQDFGKEIDKKFEGIATRISNALSAGSGRKGVPFGIRGITDSTERELEELWKKTPARITNAYIDIAKAQGKDPKAYTKRLFGSLRALETFNSLPAKTHTLARDIINHAFDPQTLSGKYGATQADILQYVGLVNRVGYAFPGLIPEAAREEAYGLKNINLKHGNKARQLDRWLFNTEYNQNATTQIRDYLLSTDKRFRAINRSYNLGLKSSGIPFSDDNLDPIILNKYNTMLDLMESIEESKTRIKSGGLSKAEKNVEIKGLRSDLTKLATVGKSLGKVEEKATKEIKKINDVFIEKNKGTGLTGAVWGAIGGKIAKDLFHNAGGMLESYWGESVTRNAYASRQAYLSRVTTGAKIGGYAIGAILGGLIGGAPGAMVGGSIGSELASWGGRYKEIKFQSDMKSSSDMMGRIRNKALWGSSYNTYFAKSLTDMGIANGESAMGGLADKSMSMRARMMLGQVGEQEMLYMSMMPNYYAALMGGVTGPELLRIYQQDLANIGDPSMKYLVGQAIGNTEAFTAANSPYFGSFYNRFSGVSGHYEKAVGALEGGFVSGRLTATRETLDRDIAEIFSSARRADNLIYQGRYASETYQAAQDQMERLTGRRGDNFTIVVNIDGEEIKRDSKTADEVYVNDLQLYTVGG